MVLYPGRFDDPASVSYGLKVMPFHRLEGSQLVYQALSHAWGPKTGLREIQVEDVPPTGEQISVATWSGLIANVGSQKLYVRPNLYAASPRLRSESEESWFWIDAICIYLDRSRTNCCRNLRLALHFVRYLALALLRTETGTSLPYLTLGTHPWPGEFRVSSG